MAHFKILAFQNPVFKILAQLKILAFQYSEFKIFADVKILAFQNPELKEVSEWAVRAIIARSPKTRILWKSAKGG